MTTTLVEALRAHARAELPPLVIAPAGLERIRSTYRLSAFETDLVVLTCLPELHEGWGDLLASLGSSWRRPTLGLALRILVPDPDQRARVGPMIAGSSALASGLVRLGLPDLPRPDRPLRPSPVVAAVLQGVPPDRVEGAPVIRLPTEDGALLLECRPTLRAEIERLGRPAVVQVAGGAEVALALAAWTGRGLVRVSDVTGAPEVVEDLVSLASLTDDVVYAEVRGDVRSVRIDHGPVGGTLLLELPGEGRVDAGVGVAFQRVEAPSPTPPELARLWRHVVPELPPTANLDPLANQTRLPLLGLRRAAESARARARVEHRAVEATDLLHAVAEGRPDPSGTYARVHRPRIDWAALVVPDAVRRQLEELRDRVVHRVTVQYRWGMVSPGGRGDGVVALLHGDSGVGKTFAAEVLASALAVPLVKVDLSRVVSKYIGETEKNLEQVFAQAEGFASVLMFDEADAVFGKRTGVKDAHDRYANIETNYLLQRLETFEGIAVLATNLLQNIDSAFLRRLQLVIHLPRPTPALRRELWERSLPEGARGEDLDPGLLATRFDLVGGEIRNAALRAAYLAAARGERITGSIVQDALRAELAKKGRPFPEG